MILVIDRVILVIDRVILVIDRVKMCVGGGLFWDYFLTSLQRENLVSNVGTDRRSKITSFAVSSEITNMILRATTKSES